MPLTKSASRSISTLHDFTCLQFVPHPDRNDDEEMDEELAGIWLSGTSYGDIYLFAQRVGRPASQGVNNEVELISILSAAHHTSLIGLAYHANSDMIASCSEDGVIKFWPSRVGASTALEDEKFNGYYYRYCFLKIVRKLFFQRRDK